METDFSYLSLFLSSLRLTTPLLFAALGGLLSERSGIANIALEGFLLVGAFSAAAAASLFQDPWLGLGVSVLSGAVIGFLFSFLTVFCRADHIVSGTALNLFVFGALPLICKMLFDVSGSTPSLTLENRLSMWFFFGMALFLAFIIWLILYRTTFGLHLRACGEGVEATKSAGISVWKVRFMAVILSGMVTSLGGAFLSIAHGSQFSRGMSAGRGFIALAALILAGWRPWPVLLTCFIFGLADAAQILLQSYPLWEGMTLPVQWIQMFPYLVTLIVLVCFVGRTQPPRELGRSNF